MVRRYTPTTGLGLPSYTSDITRSTNLLGDEVLARAVGLDNRLDEVLRHVLVVGQQLLGVLGQAVAAVAEAGVVVVGADAQLQAHALDDVGGREPSRLAVGVQLIEVGRYLPPLSPGSSSHLRDSQIFSLSHFTSTSSCPK